MNDLGPKSYVGTLGTLGSRKYSESYLKSQPKPKSALRPVLGRPL
jgi:hypothetical protein